MEVRDYQQDLLAKLVNALDGSAARIHDAVANRLLPEETVWDGYDRGYLMRIEGAHHVTASGWVRAIWVMARTCA